MEALPFFLFWTPILLIFLLAVFFRTRALVLSIGQLTCCVALVGFVVPSAPQVILMAALPVGASFGSLSSPFRSATPLCGAQGREGEIPRKTIPLGMAVALAVGIPTLLAIQLQ